ncbi:hypothetical protein WJX77_012189 [Trebouxia sp. C0004]
MPLRVQPFAAGLVHRQRSHQLRHKLRASSNQTEHSLPRTALVSLRPEVLQVLPEAPFGCQLKVSPAHLDFYVLASSSVKLIWKSSADESIKACVSGRIVVHMCQSAAAICKDYDALGKLGNRTKGMWTERSIHLWQLAIQLINHPGTNSEGGLPTLSPGVPQRSTGAFPMLSSLPIGDNLTTLVLASASIHKLEHKTIFSPMYLHLKMFLGLQYSAGWYPEHRKADDFDPGNFLAAAFLLLLRLSAICSIPKLGGYSFVQLSRLQQLCQNVSVCQEAALHFTSDVARHEAWCSNLRPVLERSMEAFKSEGKEDAQEVGVRDLRELRQAKPNYFQVPASAMPPLKQAFASGWFDAMFPEGTFNSDQYFDHEVLAHLTLYCMEHGQYTRAANLLISGLSAGVQDSYQYIDAYKEFLAHATRQLFGSQDASSTEDKISLACLQEVIVQWAWVLRTVTGCVDSFQLELTTFANQTVTFARQHGQYALLWRVLSTMLSSLLLPLAPDLAAPFILAMKGSFSRHRRIRERMLQHMAENGWIKGPGAWKAAMSGFNYGGSHSEVMAACKLAGRNTLSDRVDVLLEVLANKTGTQFVAGYEACFSPKILKQQSDSFWDTHMRDMARQPLPDLQQDLKMVRLAASTCAKLLQALGRMHRSLPATPKATSGSIKPSPLDPSPAASGPADSYAAAETQNRVSMQFAEIALVLYEYCMEAGHQLAQSDADVVWDLQATPGCETMVFKSFDSWLIRRAMSQVAQTNPPKRPSSLALQHLLDDQLLQQAWQTAAIVALHYTVDHPEPALQGLTVALEGVRRDHYMDFSQELPTVCQGQYADGGPCTASAKKHGYCLRHQKQAPFSSSKHQLTVDSLLSKLCDEGHMDTSSQKLAVAKAANYAVAAEAAFVLQLHSQPASTSPAFMLTVLEKVCECGDMELAFKLLQENFQTAAENKHIYKILLDRLRPLHGVMDLVQRALTVSAAGNAVMSGLVRACSTATDSAAAWELYQDAYSYGYMLDDKAQQVLWNLQSDEHFLQLHAHFKTGMGPLVSAPSPDTLAEIAALYIVHANWGAAMAIAQELPGQKEAAEIVSGVVQGLERCNGSLMKVAMPGLQILYGAQHHAEVVKVFSAVQAHDPTCIAPEHLHMALLAWLELSDPTAATSALQRHDALAVNWTAPQQQAVFQDALRFFKTSQKDAALPLLQSVCMAGWKAKLPLAPMQAHELVLAMLSLGQTQNAFQIMQAVHLQQGAQLQLNTVAAVLNQSLERDMHNTDGLRGMSALTHDLLNLWKHCAGVKWAQALSATTAASVAELQIRAQEWQQAADMFEANASQDVTEPLWDAAATAYFHLGDMDGMQAAWSWAQTHPAAHSWVPSNPDCYMFLATALTQLYEPMEGAALLASHHKQGYPTLLSVGDCNNFIRLCLQQVQADSEHADYYEAVLTLLRHMLSSGVPQPDVCTFTSASECLLASSSGEVPDHQLLAQLQQDIWQPMHQVLGNDRSSSAAYLPALNHFVGCAAPEVFPLILLMAQNGLSGLDAECCFALAVVFEDHHQEWLCEHVGTDFMEQVQAAADEPSAKSTQLVMFPVHELPRLRLVQLRNGSHCFDLQDIEMPWWMLPVGEQLHLRAVPQTPVISGKQTEVSSVQSKESAAEKLVREYGHLDKGSGRKRRS